MRVVDLDEHSDILSHDPVLAQTIHARHQSSHSAIETKQTESLGINIEFAIQDACRCFHFRLQLHHIHQSSAIRLQRLAGDGIIIIQETA